MLSKFYSLDECSNSDDVISHLASLQNDDKIEFEIVETDMIKLVDTSGLSQKEKKELVKFFQENDVVEDSEYDDDDDDDYDDGYDDDDFDDEDEF